MPEVQSIVFGFGHRARHGKDTAAAAIKEARGNEYDIRIYSFARELKEEVNKNAVMADGMHNLFDPGLRVPGAGYMQTNGNFLALPDWVQYEPNPDMTDPLCPLGKQRTLLQWWGTEFRRAVDPDYWVNKLAERLAVEKPEIALITDMRFPNEKKFVEEYGDSIKVFRPGLASPNAHISEEALADVPGEQWGAVIHNDGSLSDMKAMAVAAFDYLMDRKQGANRGTYFIGACSVPTE